MWLTYGVAIEENDQTSAWKMDFPAKAMVARDKFVHSYKLAVADFDKKSDLDHRIGESKPWYEALIERCAKALQDIDDMENDYLQDIDVVEATSC